MMHNIPIKPKDKINTILNEEKKMNTQEVEPLVVFPWTNIQIAQEINISDKSTIPSLCKVHQGMKVATYNINTENREYSPECSDINRRRY